MVKLPPHAVNVAGFQQLGLSLPVDDGKLGAVAHTPECLFGKLHIDAGGGAVLANIVEGRVTSLPTKIVGRLLSSLLLAGISAQPTSPAARQRAARRQTIRFRVKFFCIRPLKMALVQHITYGHILPYNSYCGQF